MIFVLHLMKTVKLRYKIQRKRKKEQNTKIRTSLQSLFTKKKNLQRFLHVYSYIFAKMVGIWSDPL